MAFVGADRPQSVQAVLIVAMAEGQPALGAGESGIEVECPLDRGTCLHQALWGAGAPVGLTA